MKYILITGMLLLAFTGYAQHTVKLSVKSREDKTPLTGASVFMQPGNKTVVTDSMGIAILSNIAIGSYKVKVSYVGMEEQELTIQVPQMDGMAIEVWLNEAEEHEEEVIITATRTSRTINDIPTRVETISGEELAEKANMKPGDIRMLLSESTGIQTQQTSATSYNSSIRIQGLDGRYTQVLRDGFPLYAGFSGGLGLMQVTPLDLKQIEVIKGSSSTLYGGGAIAGLVNLVSKTPGAKRELNFLANATSAGGFDLSGFYSQKFKKAGVTIFGSANSGKAFDPARIGFTAIPAFERYTINPRLFLYGDKTTANIGFSYITEQRIGGSMDYIRNETAGYFERNHTDRFTTQAQLTHRINDHSQLNFKNSYSRFDRLIEIPAYQFKGIQHSTFSEATYSLQQTKNQWVIGANFLTDDFAEERKTADPLRDYQYHTLGVFIQNTWSPSKQFTLETGLRGDHTQRYGFELLPRISAMLRLTPQFTARAGGGLGYKIPTVFNEEAEKTQFRDILPIDQNTTQNERSAGVNVDANYRTRIGRVGFTVNQLFFYTRLNKPLVLATSGSNYQFVNAPGHIDTKGMETNLRFIYDDFKLFVGYTYADVNTHFNQSLRWLPLTARHRLNNVLMYEQEGKIKIGFEAYFFSPQQLNDGSTGRAYWTFGLMGEKTWKHFSIFLNFENFTDTRQTKFDTIYSGSASNPTFKDIYAPVDGFVVNGGVKLRL
jgi:outer membrane receptor for ferrienterochelin and colicins